MSKTYRDKRDRGPGEDRTDDREERRLEKEALDFQNRMPFYESEPEIIYSPRAKEED